MSGRGAEAKYEGSRHHTGCEQAGAAHAESGTSPPHPLRQEVAGRAGKDDAPLDVPLSTYAELDRVAHEMDGEAQRRKAGRKEDADQDGTAKPAGEGGEAERRDNLKIARPKTIDEIIACGKTAAEWAAEGLPTIDWAIPQWVAFGSLTSIEGRPKKYGGKSTLASWMVRAVLDGGEFLGQRATKTRVIWFSEQPPVIFRHLLRRAGLDERDDLKIYYRQNLPDAEWKNLMRAALKDANARRFGARVVVVDTVAAWAGLKGDTENNSGDALEAINWIGPLTAAGIAVIIMRHERKKGGEVGKAGRGSSAWEGAINHIISIRRVRGEPDSRVRQLFVSSHLAEDVPESLTIRLRDPAAGKGEGYEVLGTSESYGVPAASAAILDLLPSDPKNAMPRKTIAERLVQAVPSATLTRALAELKKEKRVRQTRTKAYYQAAAGSDGTRGRAV